MNAPLRTESKSLKYVLEYVGRRYADCTLENFETPTEAHRAAVKAVSDYVDVFPKNHKAGRNMVIVGPKGTGKDHLAVAAVRMIAERYPQVWTTYRHGVTIFSEFRSAISDRNIHEDAITERYTMSTLKQPSLLVVSDPIPPTGSATEYEQKKMLEIIDTRYRGQRPIMATVNVSSPAELEKRMGAQAADRLMHDAVIVRCNWDSYRK